MPNRLNEANLVSALKMMLKNASSGKTVYLAFSKLSFHLLIFVLIIGTAANIALIDILLQGTGFIVKASVIIVAVQLILSSLSIIAGAWLFLKGINIIIE